MTALLQGLLVAAEELDPGNLCVVREGGGPLGLKTTDNRLRRTGYETGPDIVRSPDGVSSSIQVSFIIADEAHTVRTSIINKHALVALEVLLSLLQETLWCTKVLLMPVTKWSLIFLNRADV